MSDESYQVTRSIILTEFADGSWDGRAHIHDHSLPQEERSREPVTGADAPSVLTALLEDDPRPS